MFEDPHLVEVHYTQLKHENPHLVEVHSLGELGLIHDGVPVQGDQQVSTLRGKKSEKSRIIISTLQRSTQTHVHVYVDHLASCIH